MQDVNVYGRGWREPVVSVADREQGVLIRIDDKKNPEAWLCIALDFEQLLELLNRGFVQYEAVDPEGRFNTPHVRQQPPTSSSEQK